MEAVSDNKNKNKIKRQGGVVAKIIFGIFGTFFALYSLSMILPILWAILTALKSQSEYELNSPFALPEQWLFSNFAEAFRELNVHNTNMFGMIANSLWYSAGCSLLHVLFASMVAYIFARYPFKGSGIAYSVILIIMLLPIIGSLPSQYRMFKKLGLCDSPLFLLAQTSGIGFNFIVMHGFYKNLSWSYAEAAFIDGANHATVFFRVMLPQSLGMFVALVVIEFIGLWNDYSTPMIFFPNMPTLALGLYEYEQEMIRGINMPVYFSGLIISMLPVLIIFGFFQNTIMQSVSVGGLKG